MEDIFADTGKMPPSLAARPVPDAASLPYLRAFRYLTRSRIVAFNGPGPIPLSEIAAFLSIEGITDQFERSVYLRLVTAIDEEWLKGQRTDEGQEDSDDQDQHAPDRGRQH